MNKYFKLYAVIISIDDKFFVAQEELYNPFTCFLYSSKLGTIYQTLKQANRFKQEIVKWKKDRRLFHPFNKVSYITVAEVKQVNWKKQ